MADVHHMWLKDFVARALKFFLRWLGRVLGRAALVVSQRRRAQTVIRLKGMLQRAPHVWYFLLYEFASTYTRSALPSTEPPVLVRAECAGLPIEYDITQTTQKQLYLHTTYEPHVSAYVATLRPGDYFVDVGSNVGYFTLMAAARVGQGGAVIALEPEPRNLVRLRRNIALNPGVPITLLPIAAAAVSGTATLHIHPHNEGGHSLSGASRNVVSSTDAAIPHTITVEAHPLDVRVLPLLPPDRHILVKIDVEGFELEVLRGMVATLTTRDVEVICEVSENKAALFDFLATHGYKVYALTGNRNEVSVNSDRRKRDYLFKRAAKGAL